MCNVNPPTSQTYCFKYSTILQVSQKKNFWICQVEGVDKVHKTLYYKFKWYTLLLVYAPENLDIADALFGSPCGFLIDVYKRCIDV